MMTFNQYASKNIRINQDDAGLFALVPDQSGTWMRVQCVESKKSVYCSHCSCHTFAKKQHCPHIELVQAYWNRLYPQKVETPVVETPAPAKVRKPRNGLVRKVRNGGLVRVEQPAPIAKVIEQAVEAKVPAPKKDMMSAALTTNQGFRLLR